jgi:hypothetical protein
MVCPKISKSIFRKSDAIERRQLVLKIYIKASRQVIREGLWKESYIVLTKKKKSKKRTTH